MAIWEMALGPENQDDLVIVVCIYLDRTPFGVVLNTIVIVTRNVFAETRCLFSNMARGLIVFLALLAASVLPAYSQDGCSSTGLDYTNGGSYLIDATSDDKFVFTSSFEGQ